MAGKETYIEIEKGELLPTVQKLVAEGGRIATATCLDIGDQFEVIYHFHKDMDLVNLRLKVGKEEEVPSLSGIHLPAVMIENEMKDFFGINIVGVAIDFLNRMELSKDDPQRPMLKD